MTNGPGPEHRKKLELYVQVGERLHKRLTWEAMQMSPGERVGIIMEIDLVKLYLIDAFKKMLDGDWEE